jgi:hypothetical protein
MNFIVAASLSLEERETSGIRVPLLLEEGYSPEDIL